MINCIMTDTDLITNLLSVDTTSSYLCDETQFICIFCNKISNYKNIIYKLNNNTLIYPHCNVDCMILNNFSKSDILHFNKIKFDNSNSLLETNNIMTNEKYFNEYNKTVRVIYIDSHPIKLVTTYYIENLINIH